MTKPKRNRAKRVLVLRTCSADMSSHNGFIWPKRGPVSCGDFQPIAECGNGLHGFLFGEGDGTLASADPDAKWLVVSVLENEVINLNGKVKFPRGNVVFCGTKKDATDYLAVRVPNTIKAIIGHFNTSGDSGTSTSGNRGTSTSGNRGTSTSGYGGTSTSGYRGTSTSGYRGTSTSGDSGTSTCGYGGTSTSGNRGTSTSGDGGTSTSGYGGTSTSGYGGTSTSGYGGKAKSGNKGALIIKWYDSNSDRYRFAVGYVGEDGIKPNTFYQLDYDKNFIEVK